MSLTIESLNRCGVAEFVEQLGSVFEHAPWVAEVAAARRPFEGVAALHAAMLQVVRELPADELVKLLSGHPELAGSAAREGQMTAESIEEQGSLSLESLSPEEGARWDRLNELYRVRFGFPFILCIRRHTQASALNEFERRLECTRAEEIEANLQEIGHITRLRLDDRIAA